MFTFLVQLATIFSGVAALAAVSESAAQGKRNRTLKRAKKQATILPREAANELEQRIPGLRVKVGLDVNEKYVLVVTKPSGIPHPDKFAGYDVILNPRLGSR